MALEAGTYLDDLVNTNPVGATDFYSAGDDHIRLIKKVLLNSFPSQVFPIGIVTETGAADVYAGAMSPAPAALVNGLLLWVKFVNANTGASTFNLNSLGAQAIVRPGGTALISGDISANQFGLLVYNLAQTRYELLSVAATGSGLLNLVEDLTPQLGAALDTNAFSIDQSEGANIASGATADIWANDDGDTVHITGTTTITSLGTAPRAGCWKKVIFDGVLTLEDGANLNLQADTDRVTAVDDFMMVYAETTTLFKIIYFPKSGVASVVADTDGLYQSVQVYTSNDTWTKPAGLNRVRVTVIGGGGGGGNAGISGASAAGGGGGGGAVVETIEVGALGATETVTVGTGGAGATTGGVNGSVGVTSSFGSLCSATGGAGGDGVNIGGGGGVLGGVGSSGDMNVRGGAGGMGHDVQQGGMGGDTLVGGGGLGGDPGNAGGVGGTYGGGGGGGCRTSGGNFNGGNGGAGIVIVEEFF